MDLAREITEFVEHVPEVEPCVSLTSPQSQLEGGSRLRPPFFGGKGVTEVERTLRRPEVGSPPKARLRLGEAAAVGERAAQIHELVHVDAGRDVAQVLLKGIAHADCAVPSGRSDDEDRTADHEPVIAVASTAPTAQQHGLTY